MSWRLIVKSVKLLLAGFALAVATLIVLIGVFVGLGRQEELAQLVASDSIPILMLVLTVLWILVIRKRLS